MKPIEKFTIGEDYFVILNVSSGEITKVLAPILTKAISIHVPSVSPGGARIKRIGSQAFEGFFDVISFDDSIEISESAFDAAFIKTIIWRELLGN